MANSISYASKYIAMLDRIFMNTAATIDLAASADTYRLDDKDEKTLYIMKMALQGLGNYTRATGYDSGDITVTWQNFAFSQDRSKKFNLDKMDAKEALMTITQVAAEFQRTKVVPEIDAYRFEKLYSYAGNTAQADLTYDTVIAAIRTAIQVLDDAEVPKEGRILYVSSNVMQLMEDSGEFFKTVNVMNNNGVVNTQISSFNGMPIRQVASTRFYEDFDFAASGAGGFSPAAGAKELNFVIVHKPSVAAIVRHSAPKMVAPESNQTYDGWTYYFRVYHDLFVGDNKVNGIYAHKKTT